MANVMTDVTDFRVGAVLSRSMTVLRQNFMVFGTVALLFTWPLLFVSDGVDSDGVTASVAGETIGGAGQTLGLILVVVAIVVVVVLIWLALYELATSTMVYGTFQALRGRPITTGECIRRALPTVPRVIGIACLTTVLIVLVAGLLSLPGILVAFAGGGFFAFLLIAAGMLIPSAMIYAALWIAVPVAVVERSGIIASMRRSAALTDGYRWRVFGILLVLGLLNGVVESIVLLPFARPEGVPAGVAETIIGFAVTAFFTAWGAVAAAVAYHDIRMVREGIGVNEIAAVFD